MLVGNDRLEQRPVQAAARQLGAEPDKGGGECRKFRVGAGMLGEGEQSRWPDAKRSRNSRTC